MIVTFSSKENHDYIIERYVSTGTHDRDYYSFLVSIDLDDIDVFKTETCLMLDYTALATNRYQYYYDFFPNLISSDSYSELHKNLEVFRDFNGYCKIDNYDCVLSCSNIFNLDVDVYIKDISAFDPLYNYFNFNFEEVKNYLFDKETAFSYFCRNFDFPVDDLHTTGTAPLIVTFHYDSTNNHFFILLCFPKKISWSVTASPNNQYVYSINYRFNHRYTLNYEVCMVDLKKIATTCCLKACVEPDKYIFLSASLLNRISKKGKIL